MKQASERRLNEYSAHELVESIRNGKTSSRKVTEAVFDCIRERDGGINAYITLNEADALQKADEVDRRVAAGESVGSLA